MVAVQVGIVIVSLLEVYILSRVDVARPMNFTLIESVDTVYFGLTALFLFGLIASGITFIRWFRRAYYNLTLLPCRTRHGDGWAAGSWFVPILNLFRPYSMVKELFAGSSHLLRKDPAAEKLPRESRTAGIWWGAWVCFSVLSRVFSKMDGDLETVAAMQASFERDIILYVIGAVAAWLAARVVREYAGREELLQRTFRPDRERILDSFGPDAFV